MSQKKIKRLKKEENVEIKVVENIGGIRSILKNNWKFLVGLVIGTFLLYFNSLGGNFVSDDYASITQNPDIKNFGVALKIFSLQGIINSVISIIFGTTSPIPFHLCSLILYLLVLVAGFVLVFLLTKSKAVSMITLILYACLPIHVENISWISGRPYLFVALFVFISLDLFILFLNKRQNRYLWLILPNLFLLFITDRIRGFAVVILGLFYFLTYKKELGYKIKLGKIIAGLILVTSVLAIVSMPMIKERIASVNGGINASDSLFYNPLFQYPTAISKYLQLMFLPVDLTLYHTMYVIPVWMNWLIILTYISLVVYFFFKEKILFFALAFIFLASAPSMAPVKVSWLVAERYLLMGSLGFCLFLVLFFKRFINKKTEGIMFIVFLIVVGLFCCRVFLRNIDWKTNHNLWVITCQVSPNSHNAWNNIGDDYDKLGQYENAIKGFTQSTVVKPNYADAFHNRANIFYKMGRFDLARDSYETGLYFNPAMYQSYISLIQIDLTEKNGEMALSDLARLQKAQPNNMQVAYISAVVYAQTGKIDESKQILKQILQVYPQFGEAQNLLNQLNQLKN